MHRFLQIVFALLLAGLTAAVVLPSGPPPEVLENLGTAMAIFGTDLHLDFYNTAYVRLWDIEERFFQNRPHLGDVLEVLREHRMLPEQPAIL